MIKKLIIGILIFSGTSAFAEASGPDFYKISGVAQGDTLNIHKEPHVKSKVVGEIVPGTDCIKNLGCKGGLTMNEFMNLSKAEQERIKKERPRWCKIAFDGVEGWVYGKYVTEGSCQNSDGYKMR